MKPKIVNVKFNVPEIHLLNQAVKHYYFSQKPEGKDSSIFLPLIRKLRTILSKAGMLL